MAFGVELVIGTSTHTNHLVPGSINLFDNLDSRTALSFQMRLPTSDTKPVVGQPVYLASSTSGSTWYVFGGTLDNYSETVYNTHVDSTNTYLQLDCNAVDFTQMMGKRRVYKTYYTSGLGDYDNVMTTESFDGDGSNRVFELTYATSTDPTVTVNGLAATVGVKGVATSTKGYYYTPSSNLILSNTSNNALASTDVLGVVYNAMVGIAPWDYAVIADINTNFLDGEGLDAASYVSTGIQLTELNFNFIPANEALNIICEMTGRAWYVDPWKRIHYFARSENAAPFNISSTSNNWRSLTVKHSRDKYRNKEYVLGSFGITPMTESFYGDGVSNTFTVTYPLYEKPVITVDGFNVTSVGILGVDTSTHAYYWQKESNIITGNTTNAMLASTDLLKVSYTGIYPVVAVASDGAEIAARATIESNSGKYEEVTEANKTYIAAAANQYGYAILNKYGKPLDTIRFETDSDGLLAGQLINVDITNNSLSGLYYIISVQARDVGMSRLRYTVTAVSGVDRGGWVSFFRNLVNSGKSIYTEPYQNLVQTVLLYQPVTLKFHDSGCNITNETLTEYLVDDPASQVDTAYVV